MSEPTETNPRGAGRPRKENDPRAIMEKTLLKIAEVADDLANFTADQVKLLKKDAEGITVMKQRQEVLETASKMTSELLKAGRATMAEVEKQPKEEESFNFEKFIEDLRK